MADLGAGALAELLGRSVKSVRKAAHRYRISLRKPGSRRGLILGQPRDMSFLEDREKSISLKAMAILRRDVIEGRLDPVRLERAVHRAYLLATGAPLCPRCTCRPQEQPSGFCRDCHLKVLAQAHRDELTQHEAQQELWRERTRKVRRR